MTVILNRPKRVNKGSMKTTDTVEHVEGMILERLEILKNGETKEQKRKARSEIIKLEKHLRGVNDKYINGHKYPERMKGFPDDKPMNKEEVLKLIDSVDVPTDRYSRERQIDIQDQIELGLNLEGVSVGKNTFEYVDKGWSKPKEMKPVNLFK